MRPIVNFGSLNLDDVYRVDRIVRPGETLSARSYQLFPGGKGLNQSLALGRAGALVRHVGRVGTDGRPLADLLAAAGVEVSGILVGREPTGRALIQVDDGGQNAIVLFPGANRTLSEAEIADALELCLPGDLVLTQNETSGTGFLLAEAARRGLKTVFNPAPMGPEVRDYPLETVGLLVMNETEAEALAGAGGPPEEVLGRLADRFPAGELVLTVGAEGAWYRSADEGLLRVPGRRVRAVDTTAAGDTFLGYFLAARQAGLRVREALETANRAAALAVTRPGAASSIPWGGEVAAAGL